MQNKTPNLKKSVNQPQTKNISKDLLLYEWYSHVGTFIEIRCDDASRALKSHTAQHRLLLDSGRINDIKKSCTTSHALITMHDQILLFSSL